jgi:hypothetical protein
VVEQQALLQQQLEQLQAMQASNTALKQQLESRDAAEAEAAFLAEQARQLGALQASNKALREQLNTTDAAVAEQRHLQVRRGRGVGRPGGRGGCATGRACCSAGLRPTARLTSPPRMPPMQEPEGSRWMQSWRRR